MRNTRLAKNSKHEPLKGGSILHVHVIEGALFLHVYATQLKKTCITWDLEWV